MYKPQDQNYFDPMLAAVRIEYRGFPTYTKITKKVSTTTVFGLSVCKWGIFALVGDPLQSH